MVSFEWRKHSLTLVEFVLAVLRKFLKKRQWSVDVTQILFFKTNFWRKKLQKKIQ